MRVACISRRTDGRRSTRSRSTGARASSIWARTKIVKGSLWVTGASSVYRLRDGQTTRYTETNGLSPRVPLRPHCEDDDGGIWFSMGELFNEGIGVVRFKDGRFTAYGSETGLPVTSYLQLVVDREGSIWIASSSGLYRLRRKPITAYSRADGLPHDEVYPLLQTRDGRIWVGSIHGLGLLTNGAVVRDHPLQRFYRARAVAGGGP